MLSDTFRKLYTSIRLAFIKSAQGWVPISVVDIAQVLVGTTKTVSPNGDGVDVPAADVAHSVVDGSGTTPVHPAASHKAPKKARHPRRPNPFILALRTRQLAAVKLTPSTAVGVFAHVPIIDAVQLSEVEVDDTSTTSDTSEDIEEADVDVDDAVSDLEVTMVEDEDIKVDAKDKVEVLVAEDVIVGVVDKLEETKDAFLNEVAVEEVVDASVNEDTAIVDDPPVAILTTDDSTPAEDSPLSAITQTDCDHDLAPAVASVFIADLGNTGSVSSVQDDRSAPSIEPPAPPAPVASSSLPKLNVNSAAFVPSRPTGSLPTPASLNPQAPTFVLKPKLNANAPPFSIDITKQVEKKIAQLTSVDPAQQDLEAKLAAKIALLECQALNSLAPARPHPAACSSFSRPPLSVSAPPFRPPAFAPSACLNVSAPTFTPGRVAVAPGKENKLVPCPTVMPYPHPRPRPQPSLNINAKPFSMPSSASKPNTSFKVLSNRLDPGAAAFTPSFGASTR